jgi:hypothetical protein
MNAKKGRRTERSAVPSAGNALLLPEFEDEATLYSLSSEFLESATLLSNAEQTGLKCMVVTFYLAGHAAELLLKSFLFKQGDTINFLRKRYGHDLKLLVRRARMKGLPLAGC